jgi:hypothetical protein
MVQHPADNLEMARLAGLAQRPVSISSIANQEHEIADWTHEHLRSIHTAIDLLASAAGACHRRRE